MATKNSDWQISRGYVGYLGHIFYRPIFIVKARNQDDAIWRAAHKIKGVAMLKATRLTPLSDKAAKHVKRRSFFLCLKLSKK
jgi:hypothetical protein